MTAPIPGGDTVHKVVVKFVADFKELLAAQAVADRLNNQQRTADERQARYREAAEQRRVAREEAAADRARRRQEAAEDRYTRSREAAADRARRRQEDADERSQRRREAFADRLFRRYEQYSDRQQRRDEARYDRTEARQERIFDRFVDGVRRTQEYERRERIRTEEFTRREQERTEQFRLRQQFRGDRSRSRGLSGFLESFGNAFRATRDDNEDQAFFARIRRAMSALRSEDRRGGFFTNIMSGMEQTGRRIQIAIRHFGLLGTAIALVVAGAGPLISILGALGGAVLGFANALYSASGALFAIPGLLAAAVAGFGALYVAAQPLANVFKLFSAQQEAIAQSAQEGSRQQSQAASQIRSAYSSIRSASRSLRDAYEAERDARKNLNESYKDARRELEDLRASVAGAAVDEESALIALAQAQDDWKRSIADSSKTELDRREAANIVREAELRLAEVRRTNSRNAEDLAEAERKGIDGSDKVVQARKNLRDATERVKDAQYQLADAQANLNKVMKESAAGGSAVQTATDKLNAALAKLSPSARKVAELFIGMNDSWKKVSMNVQEATFAPLVAQLGNLRSLLPIVETLLVKAGSAIGQVASKAVEMVSSGPWKSDFLKLAEENAFIIETIGDAALYVADAFRHITMAAAPFTRWVVTAIKDMAKGFAEWAERARNSGSLAEFLEKTQDRLSSLWTIAKNVILTFAALFKASDEFTDWLLGRSEDVTGSWRETAEAQTKSGSALKKWLEDIKPLLSEIAKFFGAIVRGFASIASEKSNIDAAVSLLKAMREELGGPLKSIINELSANGALETIVKGFGDLLRAFDKFLKAGGGEALVVFAVTFAKLMSLFLEFISLPGVSTVFAVIANGLAILAAASLVARFTGLFALFRILRAIFGLFGGTGAVVSGIRTVFGSMAAWGSSLSTIFATLFARISATFAAMSARIAASFTGLAARLGAALEPVALSIARWAGVISRGVAGFMEPVLMSLARISGIIFRFSAPLTAALLVAKSAKDLVKNEDNDREDLLKWASLVSPGLALARPIARKLDLPGADKVGTTDDLKKQWDTVYGAFMRNVGSPVARWFRSDFMGIIRRNIVSPISNFFTKTMPDLLERGFEFFNSLPRRFRRSISFALGYLFDQLTVQLPLKFVETAESIRKSFLENVVDPIVNAFNTVTSAEFWLGLWTMVSETFLKYVWEPIKASFMLLTDPKFWAAAWELVSELFFEYVGSPVADFFRSAFSAEFWTELWEVVSAIFLEYVGGPIADFVTQSIPNFFTKSIPRWFSGVWNSFYEGFIRPFLDWLSNIPDKIRDAFKQIWEDITGGFSEGRKASQRDSRKGKADGGWIRGQGTGTSDSIPIMASNGEFMVKERVAKRIPWLLEAINDERISPADLLGALSFEAAVLGSPGTRMSDIGISKSTISNISNTIDRGMAVNGNVTINNPVREKAGESLYRLNRRLAFRRS